MEIVTDRDRCSICGNWYDREYYVNGEFLDGVDENVCSDKCRESHNHILMDTNIYCTEY